MTPVQKSYAAALREERRQALVKGKSTDDIDAELDKLGVSFDPNSDPADPDIVIEPDAPKGPNPDIVKGLREEHRGYVVNGKPERAQEVVDELTKLGAELYPPPVVVDEEPAPSGLTLASLVETDDERKAREKAERAAAKAAENAGS